MNDVTRQTLDTIFNAAPIAPPTELAVREVADVVTGEIMTVTDSTATALVIPDAEVPTQEEIEAKEDYEFSRGAIKSVAVEAQTTLSRAVDAAVQTDAPRAFEAVADMLRATLEAHRELQSLHKTAADVRAATAAAKAPPGTVNVDKGVIFTGTSDELLRLIDPERT